MQVAVRDIRLSTTPAGVEKRAVDVSEAAALAAKALGGAIDRAVNPENKERLQNIEALTTEYGKSASELAKTQLKIFESLTKRADFSSGWAKAFEAQLASPALTEAANHFEIEKTLNEADSMFNAMRAATWRLSTTGEQSQKQEIELRTGQMNDALVRARSVVNNKGLQSAIDSLTAIAKGFSAATTEVVQLEAVKKDIVDTKTLPIANRAQELMGTTIRYATKVAEEAKTQAATELTQANRLSFAAAVAVMLSLVGSVIFTFLGVARPLTRLNGALGKMAAGELNIEIPGANRGDEVGDMAKTVVVIREKAEQKARDEAEAKANQDKHAAEQRRADMIKLADGSSIKATRYAISGDAAVDDWYDANNVWTALHGRVVDGSYIDYLRL